MFQNETYSFLFGVYERISPLLTIWYVYLYYFKLLPKLAEASLSYRNENVYEDNEQPIKYKEIFQRIVLAQVIVIFMSRIFQYLFTKKK